MPTFYGQLPHQLKESCLDQVAAWLIEEWDATAEDMTRRTDTPYTRGTACFGRQKERISQEYRSRRHSWLQLENNGLDLVFSVCNFSCRFSNDDPNSPKKRAVNEPHELQMRLFETAEPGEAVRFVFIVDHGVNEDSEPRVVLMGFSTAGEVVCRWQATKPVRVLSEATPSLQPAVEVAKPKVTAKRQSTGEDAAAT